MGRAVFNLIVIVSLVAVFARYKMRVSDGVTSAQHAVARLTADELVGRTGIDRAAPIYAVFRRVVYDVSSKPETFGPNGKLHFLTGADRSAAAFGRTGRNLHDLTTQPAVDKRSVDAFEGTLLRQYPVVGELVGPACADESGCPWPPSA